MSKIKLMIEMDEETYKQIKGDSIYDNNNKIIISKSSSAYYALNAIINATPITESDDCVSRQAVLEVLNKYGKFIFVTNNPKYTDMVDEIANLSSVTPKREQGEWIKDDFTGLIKCSRCKNDAPISTVSGTQYESDFCQSCGAEMAERGKE